MKLDLNGLKSRDHSPKDKKCQSLLMENDYEREVDTYLAREEELARLKEKEKVPNMHDILDKKKLKIVVKMTHHNYSSVRDIFSKLRPRKYMTDREKILILKEQRKRAELKL